MTALAISAAIAGAGAVKGMVEPDVVGSALAAAPEQISGITGRPSVGSDPIQTSRRVVAEKHLSQHVHRVTARISFLAKFVLGPKKTVSYKNRDVGAGFAISGGRGFSSTMEVGVPLERMMGLSGGWDSLFYEDKKRGIETLLREQILAGNFSTHNKEKIEMLEKGLLRFLEKAPTSSRVKVLSLLLGDDLINQLKTLSESEQLRVITRTAKRLKMGLDTPAAALEAKLEIEDFLEIREVGHFLTNPSSLDSEIVKELADSLQIGDVTDLETLVTELEEGEKNLLEQMYFMESCFEALRTINSNRNWLKTTTFGGIILAGTTLLTQVVSLQSLIISAGVALGIAGVAAATPYILPVLIGVGIGLILLGFLLNNCENKKNLLRQERRAIDALLSMNEAVLKEMETSKDKEHLKAFAVSSEQVLKFLGQTLEGLKRAHIDEGTNKLTRLKRVVLGDRLKARVTQMERMLDKNIMARRADSMLAARIQKEMAALTDDTRELLRARSKEMRKKHQKTLSGIEKRMAQIQARAKSEDFWMTTKGLKRLGEVHLDLIPLIETETDRLDALLKSLASTTDSPTLRERTQTAALSRASEALRKLKAGLTAKPDPAASTPASPSDSDTSATLLPNESF